MEHGTKLRSNSRRSPNGIYPEAIINEGYDPKTPFGLFAVTPLGGELTCREPSPQKAILVCARP